MSDNQPQSPIALREVNYDIETLMRKIADRLGGKYKLTLICRYSGDDFSDADILKSNDDFEAAVAAGRHLMTKDPVT